LQQREKPPHGASFVQRQAPPLQRLLLFPQRLPQRPQLSSSLARSWQLPLQQLEPLSQALPQRPQLLAFEPVSTQLPLQQLWPEAQLALLVQMHLPPEQLCPLAQAWLQPPQFLLSVAMLISQPSAAWPLQLAKLGLQLPIWQLPELQLLAALAKPQRWPHLPQLLVVFRSVSQPSEARFALQSP
jgi:hypothetical protein